MGSQSEGKACGLPLRERSQLRPLCVRPGVVTARPRTGTALPAQAQDGDAHTLPPEPQGTAGLAESGGHACPGEVWAEQSRAGETPGGPGGDPGRVGRGLPGNWEWGPSGRQQMQRQGLTASGVLGNSVCDGKGGLHPKVGGGPVP